MKEENEEQQIAALLKLAGPRPRVSDEVKARVRAAVHEEWQWRVRNRSRMRVMGIAAAVLIAIAAISLFVPRTKPVSIAPPVMVATVQAIHGSTTPSLAPQSQIAQQTWIETADDSTLSLAWNGAALRLDKGTLLRFDSTHVATLERGAVYFDGFQTRVTIHTPLGDIRDIGTMFEARLENDTLRIRVREGIVDLTRGTEHATANAYTELVASAAGIERRAIEISGADWKWIEDAAPAMRLEGLTLKQAMDRVAREKGLRVELRGVEGGVRLHGRTEFTPDEALDAATAAAAVSYRVESGKLIVSGRR